jgi:hypothetical protein
VTPGIVRLDARAEVLISRFSVAWVEDKAIERKVKRSAWLAVACVLAVFVVMGVFKAPVVGALAGLLMVFFVVSAYRYHRLDIEDRKLQTVMRVLKVLRADLAREQRVALTVDLRRFTAGARVKNGRVTRYQHRWLELTTTLADGNTISLDVTDRVKQKSKRKRTRTLAHSEVRIGVRFAKRYRPIGPIADALRGHAPGAGSPGPFSPGADDRSPDAERRLEACYRTRRAEGAAPAAAPHGWDGLATADTLLSTMRHVYRGIAQARRTA